MEEILTWIFQMVYSLASMAWGVLPVIGIWLVFEKAGEKGWKAVIPFYNMYTLLKLGDKKKFWGLYLAGCILYIITACIVIMYLMWVLMAFIFALGAVDLGWDTIATMLPVVGIFSIAVIAGYIMMMVAMIHGYAGICKKMNQGAGMVVGLIFLGPIFWMLLGAGKQYEWEKPVVPEYQAPAYNPDEYHPPEWQEPFAAPQQNEEPEWDM